MIIKSKRIRARGQALKRALAHIQDGEDNDEVILLRGNLADLEDARSDALRFGRQYCLRHWIISPGEEITLEQLEDLIERLAVEFGFDPKRIAAWGHAKLRAAEDGCPHHFHILVPEVDPISGGVMSSSHDFDRQSKIARVVEVAWGHSIVPPPRMNSVIAALERQGDHTTAAALRGVASPDHPASFDEADHQRSKRHGIDLPRVREMVSEALANATNRVDFEARLASIGLRLRDGDEKDVPIVETTDGTFVGSLARLTRLRKAALEERMRFDATGKPKAKTDHPSSYLSPAATIGSADAAGCPVSAGGGRPERARSDGHYHRTPSAIGERGRADTIPVGDGGRPPRRRDRDERDQKRRARLKLAAAGVRHTGALLDLLGAARHAALPPLERVVSGLNDCIERETVALRVSELAEPASLLAARRKADEASALVPLLEAKADRLTQRIVHHPSQPIWTRLFGGASAPDRRSLEIRLDGLKDKISAAGANLSGARTP